MTFNPETYSKIVADSPRQIRRCDVFRLLDSLPENDRNSMCYWLAETRPDLSEEVGECMKDISPL
jgi:hypothetical protein